MIKRIIKITYIITAVFGSLLFLLYLLVNTNYVQNYLAQTAIKKVKEQYGVTIMLKSISYDGWSYFSLRNVGLADHKNDTLFYAGRVQFDITGIAIDSTKFTFSNIVLDEGLCKLKTYKDSTYGLQVLEKFNNPQDTIISKTPFTLVLKNVELMDSRFVMYNELASNYIKGFDPNNIYFNDIYLRSKLFTICGDSLNFNIRNLRGKEHNGAIIKSFNAQAIICKHLMEFAELDAYVNNSHVKDYFAMEYNDWHDFNEFEELVNMRANVKNSKVDIKDAAIFAPALSEYNYNAMVSGKLNGPLSRMRIRDIEVFSGEKTMFKGKLNITGLPVVDETFIDATADFAQTTQNELEKIINVNLPAIVADLGTFSFKGKYTGYFYDFVSYGTFESAFGLLETDLNMKLELKDFEKSKYKGDVKFNNFFIGKLLKNDKMGLISGNASVEGKGFDLKTVDGRFDADIDHFYYNKYDYHGISFNVKAVKESLNGEFSINDENLNLHASGMADLRNQIKKFNFNLQLFNANLKTLNFINENIKLSTNINGNFNFKSLSNNNGKLLITNTVYDKDGYIFRLDNFTLQSKDEHNIQSMVFDSDVLKFEIKGSYNLENIYGQLYQNIQHVFSNYLPEQSNIYHTNQDFTFRLNVKNTVTLSPLLFPGFDVNDLQLNGAFNSTIRNFDVVAKANNLRVFNNNFKKPALKIELKNGNDLKIIGSLYKFLKNDTTLIGDIDFIALANNNYVSANLDVLDSSGLLLTSLNNNFNFYKDSIVLHFEDKSVIGSNKIRLKLDTLSQISFTKGLLYFSDLHFFNKQNNIFLNGYTSIQKNDNNINLAADIKRLELSLLNQLQPQLNIDINGTCTGDIALKSKLQRKALISHLQIKNLSLDKDTIGSYIVESDFNESQKGILVNVKSTEGKIKNLNCSGIIDLANNNVDLAVNFSRSEVVSFKALLKDYVSLYEGRASLSANIKGSIDNPEIYGNLTLADILARVEYLKTTYRFSNNLNFNKNIIDIEPFKIFDQQRNEASVSGKVTHNNFSNLNFNINLSRFTNFEVLNTTPKDNNLFFGKAYATGNAQITGTTNKIQMVVNATSNKNSNIVINPFAYSDDNGDKIINFINYFDTLPGEIKTNKPVPLGFGIKLNLRVTPDAEVKMIFDPNADDNIRAVGEGNLTLELTQTGEFLMKGNYSLTNGDYYLTAANVVSKKFKLRQGSTIQWSGDPQTGKLDIIGFYRLRTTINEIVRLPQGANAQNRIPVECIINIKGTVEKPIVGFDLNFPELDNYVTGTASNELNAVIANFRREPDLMNQQILFLLISGRFIPLNNDNIANQSGNIGQQTVSDLFTSSASGLLNAVIPDFDVSVDMLNATDPTRGRAYLLSASKRFLNNRLEVQGSYATDNSQNNFIASYNIAKSGRLKGRVFNRSGLDPIYNRNIITSGFGLYYRKEFDKLIEIFIKQNQFSF
ncbi:MAG: translocation/assembly module TamB domain-containing protein [Bacteroidia bacterium]